MPCTVIVTDPRARESGSAEEVHVPARASTGRLERTRLRPYLDAGEGLFRTRLVQRLERLLRERGATAVHGLPHSTDFIAAREAAERVGIPFFLSVHDDLRHTLRARPDLGRVMKQVGRAWREAEHRFVISEAMGAEYDYRFGKAPWTLVSDVADPIADGPPTPQPDRCDVYFMSSFFPYRDNFAVLVEALDQLGRDGASPRLVLRGAGQLALELPVPITLELLPFASDAEIANDLDDVDLLYLPLPFDEEMRDFVRFSLSTKMVTYLASGRPILYHGPPDAAAARLLADHGAGVIVPSLERDAVVGGVREARDRAHELGANALALARSRFAPEKVVTPFWSRIVGE